MSRKIFGFEYGNNQALYEKDYETRNDFLKDRRRIKYSVPVKDLTIYNDDYTFENYGDFKSNYYLDLIVMSIRNDIQLNAFVKKNKKALLSMKKDYIIYTLLKVVRNSYTKEDLLKAYKNRSKINYAFLLYEIRNI